MKGGIRTIGNQEQESFDKEPAASQLESNQDKEKIQICVSSQVTSHCLNRPDRLGICIEDLHRGI